MGAGKTTIMAEASDLLTLQAVVHAAIDLDGLGLAHLPSDRASSDVMYANLRSVWANYAAAGVKHLLIAAAVESRAELDRIVECVPEAAVIVCRVRAPIATMEARVRQREPGMWQE